MPEDLWTLPSSSFDRLIQGTHMKLLLPLVALLLPAVSLAQPQQPESQPGLGAQVPRTTEVLVIMTAKQAVTRQQIMKVMPVEIRATVKLYLTGEIRQWYSRGDGRGVILVLDAKTVDDARAIMASLSKEKLMDQEYIPVGPLLPLASLIGDPGRQ